MTTTHILKVHPEYMDALLDGTKPFEVRRNDRGFQKGDYLELVEHGTRPGDRRPLCAPDCKDAYCTKARTITWEISYVYTGDPRCGGHGGLAEGYVVLGLTAPVEDTP